MARAPGGALVLCCKHGNPERTMSVLELTSISKHFGAIQALIDMSLTLARRRGGRPDGRQRRGQVHAGEDHRRQLRAERGHDHAAGPPVAFHKPADARDAGIEIVYQDLALCDNLSAAENVFLGRELMRRIGPLRVLELRAACSSAPASCSSS